MSSRAFGSDYAAVYDWLYSDKDYAAECDRLEELFRRHGAGKIGSVLDLGCGTGGHAFPLAARGYQVVGVDHSPGMIAQAEQKLANLNPEDRSRLDILHGDLQLLHLDRRFDATLMMFAVLGYQTTNAQVSAALDSARRHLEPLGLLIFDVWYGPAVLNQRPSKRRKVMEGARGQMLRKAAPVLDVRRHLCQVRYRVQLGTGDQPVHEFAEDHTMRFFFPMELEQFLHASDFELIHLSDFDDLGAEPTLETWNVLACARAV